MSDDINVTDGIILEALNNKVDIDGGNYKGSELETYIHEHCGADKAAEKLTEKLTECIAVVETYQNGSSWYRVYSDGWCEQGGIMSCTSGVNTTVNLLVNFKDNNYIVNVTYNSPTTGAVSGATTAANNKNTSYFQLGTGGGNYAWQASGYIR